MKSKLAAIIWLGIALALASCTTPAEERAASDAALTVFAPTETATPTPIPSATPALPTPTATPIPPTEVSVLIDEAGLRDFNRLQAPVLYTDDAVNDPQKCYVDSPNPETIPGNLDLVAGEVALDSQDPAQVRVTFIVSNTIERTGSFLGMGFEVDDPRVPNKTDSTWLFDNLGDRSFNGQQYGSLQSPEPAFAILENNNWNVYQPPHTLTYTTDTDGVVFTIPKEWLVGTVNPLITITDGEVCDSLPLDSGVWEQFINNPDLQPPAAAEEPAQILSTWSAPDNARYMNGGSFAGSTSGEDNAIHFKFILNGAAPCKNLFMPSVFHIRPDANPDQVLQNPSAGYSEEFIENVSAMLGFVPAEDTDAVNGYLIDAPPRLLDPAASEFQPNNNPSMPSFEINGNTLTAVDAPSFLKEGHTAYFETAVVCLDGGEIKILGSTRWVHRDGISRIIPNPQGGVDWGPASESFTAALQGWLDNRAGN
jgi:hypothetical protein